MLQTKSNMRVVTIDLSALAASTVHTRELRSILGALLVQQRDEVSEARTAWPSTGAEGRDQAAADRIGMEALRFAWRVMAHVKSNTVIFTNEFQTRAIGAGQMSRVDAVQSGDS